MRHFFRNLIANLLIIALLFNFSASAAGYYYDGAFHEYTAEPITLKVNGETIDGDMPPILLSDRAMVPAFFVFSSLNAEVSWLAKTRQVRIVYNDNIILLTIDSRKVLLNNKAIYINDNDPPAKIINDRTMIPARFVSENLGLNVSWNDKTRTVSIDSPNSTAKPTITPASGWIDTVTYNNDTVTLKGKGLDNYKISFLPSPNRYIFDFYDVSFKIPDKNHKYENGIVYEMRYASHNGYARIVLETGEEELKYSHTATDNTFTIFINESEVSTSQPNTPPTNAPTATIIPSESPTATPKPTYAPREPNEKPIVILDAGHGGTDPGALGKNDLGEIVAYEKDINLPVTLKVYNLLINAGIDTFLTRKDDTFISLGDRSSLANRLNADLFVSIHSNAIENTVTNGMMIMHNPNSAKDPNPYYFTHSTELADLILSHMKNDTDLKNLGLRDGSDLWVIRKTLMPAVLIELGFITNESDRAKITDDAYQNILAEAIFKGIMDALAKNK